MNRTQESIANDFKFLISSHVKYHELTKTSMNRIYRLGQELGFCNEEIGEILEDFESEYNVASNTICA